MMRKMEENQVETEEGKDNEKLQKNCIVDQKMSQDELIYDHLSWVYKYIDLLEDKDISPTDAQTYRNEFLEPEDPSKEIFKYEEQRHKDMRKPDMIQSPLTDATDILKQKYLKKDKEEKKLQDHQYKLKQLVQKLQSMNVGQMQIRDKLSVAEEKMDNILEDIIGFQRPVICHEHLLEFHLTEYKNSRIQFKKYKRKLEEQYDAVFKAVLNVEASMNNDIQLQEKEESLKRSAKPSNSNERLYECRNYKQMDKIKNPTIDHDQYDFDWQMKMMNQIEILKDEINLWKARYENDVNLWKTRYESSRMSLIKIAKDATAFELKALVSKMAVSHDPPRPEIIKSMPQIEENKKQHIFQKEKSTCMSSVRGNTLKEITLPYRDPIKEERIVMEKPIPNKNDDVQKKTETEEQNEASEGETPFFNPYCGMQYINTADAAVIEDSETFISHRNYPSTDNINPTTTDENLKKDSESIIAEEVPLALVKEKADKTGTKKQEELPGGGFTSHELCLSQRSTTTKGYSIVEETIINIPSNNGLRDDFHTIMTEIEKQELLNFVLLFTENYPEISNEIEHNREILFNNKLSTNFCNNGFAESDKTHSVHSAFNKERCICCDIAHFILSVSHNHAEEHDDVREKLNFEIMKNKSCGIQKNMKDVLTTNEPLSENLTENNTVVRTEDNTKIVIKDIITKDEIKFGAKTKVLSKNLPKEINVDNVWKRYTQNIFSNILLFLFVLIFISIILVITYFIIIEMFM